jgi:phosphoribosyl 1,2-cyclic phosphodiesterase
MLLKGPYPPFLKKRISSDSGHLSNTQAGMIALEHASSRLKYVFLSHLSENNNTPELAFRAASRGESSILKVNYNSVNACLPL